MAILLAELIKQLPSDTEDKVRTTKDRLRQRIRDILGEETRLFLQRKSQAPHRRVTPVNVQFTLKAGLPDELQPIDIQSIHESHRLSLILGPFRQTLTALADSSDHALKHLIPLLRKDLLAKRLLTGDEHHLEGASRYAAFLRQQLQQFELTKFILRVDRDVLGIYTDHNETLFGEPDPRVELYWGVIGLVARDLGVDVIDLTYVVLAHELAHAFTHAAVDADGLWWKSEHFWASDHELKEGLAQFYAELVCHRIEESAPDALKAYQALLPYQPSAYHTQERWKDFSPEHFRSAMLQLRRSLSPTTLEQFDVCLANERHRLSEDQQGTAAGA